MGWATLAQLAMTFSSQLTSSSNAVEQYKIQDTLNKANAASTNLVNQANADAANLVRAASNGFQAAQASLANTKSSIANQEKLRAFGDNYSTLQTNEVRLIDNMTRGKLSAQLKSAASLGALRADAAARGVGGSSADILRSSAALQLGATTTQLDDNKKYVQYDNLLQQQGLVRTAVNSLDLGQTMPNMDYGINVAPLAQAPFLSGAYGSPASQAMWATLGKTNAAQLGDVANSISSAWGAAKSWFGDTGSATRGDGIDTQYGFGQLGSGFAALQSNYFNLG